MSKTACVFGGTGFIGRQVVRELCKAGWRVKVASRAPESAFELKVSGSVGQVAAVPCDYSEAQIATCISDCDAVINLVGILYEKKRDTFEKIHADLPQKIAQACAAHQARFIHVSALGVDKADSRYARSKKRGEETVMKILPATTILRPSVVFGAGDVFFNRFAGMAKYMPFLPLIGGGKTKLQPVYVGDVADAVMAVLNKPHTMGRIYELGGPEILTFKEIYQRLFTYTRQPRCLIPVPFGLARLKGKILGLLPHPPLTADQVDTLRSDNIVNAGALSLKDLGIMPTALDAVLPSYLDQYRPGGRFADKKPA
jgi:uncharacterized protein YbjT (DUF2867 family)